MKALVKSKGEPGLWMEDVPMPVMGDGDVLIKVKKNAICGTDIHIYKWDAWAKKTIPVPMVVGHEFTGVVADVGKNVKGFKVGQRVSAEGHNTCGRCRNCVTGKRHLCAKTVNLGVNRPGAFAEYVVIPEENVFAFPDAISDDIAAIFDPLGNAVHTALSYDLVGEDVLITGAGPIGLMSAAICRKAGARNVIITDVNDYRLELARNMGATCIVDVSKVSLAQILPSIGITEGITVGLEMSGHPNGLKDLLVHSDCGAKIALLGILPPNTQIDWDLVIFKGLYLKGIYGREIFGTWYKMAHMLQSGLDVSPVITHHYPIDDFEKGFNIMMSGMSGKVILDW